MLEKWIIFAQCPKYYVGDITKTIYRRPIYLTKLFKIIYRNLGFFMIDSIDQNAPET